MSLQFIGIDPQTGDVRWNHFAGDGSSQGPEHTTDPAAVKLCGEAFEAVWNRGVPHDQYEIR
ncbi:DUF6879 family protein [Streptomyces griseus]|uniref:DUF6879 family protein n=1 Tax=Streptomyces griseus TaxID=1911 RepID=UPI0037B30F26